ncbi:MAG: hypothetical protein WCJ61_14845 [Paludibacter sp.]
MKKSIIFIEILFLNYFFVHSQEIINNTGTSTNGVIQQISVPGIDDILSFQTLNKGVNNYVSAQQIGSQNAVTINQKNGASSDMSNQSYTVQSGNSNELSIGQIGSGNLLLGFQLGYLATLTTINPNNQIVTPANFLNDFTTNNNGNASMIVGENNKMSIMQNGVKNGVVAIQQGTGNSISAEQMGNNNYLLAMQKGSNNTISEYKQENTSNQNMFDRIIQVGDNLNVSSGNTSNTNTIGNTIVQTGANLALELNNDLLNSIGGVKISQTGTDMKVVIDQSFFSFPLK